MQDIEGDTPYGCANSEYQFFSDESVPIPSLAFQYCVGTDTRPETLNGRHGLGGS